MILYDLISPGNRRFPGTPLLPAMAIQLAANGWTVQETDAQAALLAAVLATA